jgi:hypothetical protein
MITTSTETRERNIEGCKREKNKWHTKVSQSKSQQTFQQNIKSKKSLGWGLPGPEWK